MDIQQILRYSVSGASISTGSSADNAPLFSEWMYGPTNFVLRNTVTSPLSTLSSNQEHYSSSENLSQISPCSSAVGYNNSFNQISSSPTCFSDSLQFSSGESLGSHDQSSNESMRHALRKIETALMGPDADDEVVDNTTCDNFDGDDAKNGITWGLDLDIGYLAKGLLWFRTG